MSKNLHNAITQLSNVYTKNLESCRKRLSDSIALEMYDVAHKNQIYIKVYEHVLSNLNFIASQEKATESDDLERIIPEKRRSTCPRCQSKNIEYLGLYDKCNDCGKDWVE